ncbi:fatty acid--CoA ligase [Povalibacter sp.]|uniref:fatty acid--CoA ligase n=1 Tax=Povalibacter sp. TaxID=1962978 RepID=UPI002F403FDD
MQRNAENESVSIMTLADIPRAYAKTRPHQPALAFEGRVTTFARLDARTNQVAQGLKAAGLQPGSRIAHLGKNSDLYVELLLGAAKAGVVMTPINWRLSPREIQYILDDSNAQLLFVGAEFHAMVPSCAPKMSNSRVFGLDQPYESNGYQEWRDAQSSVDPAFAITPEAPVTQLYTSGTTGNPKGVVLSHRNYTSLQHATDRFAWSRWEPDDVSLAAMPCFHIGGTGWNVMGLYHGALNVIVREFDPTRILDSLNQWPISKMFIVPAALHLLVRQSGVRELDFSRLRFMLYGASPMPRELLRESMDVFKCGFVQLYGMTETTGAVTALEPEDHAPADNPRIASAGKPLPGVELAILDAQGRRMPTGTVGEIVIRSPTNMKSYWNLPKATAATVTYEGWLRSGDAGYLDADGYLYIYDRVKDMIISGGENIYPAEVENAIFGHPQVADVGVIGVPSDKWGEEVKAIVVSKPGAPQDPGSIVAWARERIATYKLPKSIDFVETLPRNAAGKILRKELRAPYWQGRDRLVN